MKQKAMQEQMSRLHRAVRRCRKCPLHEHRILAVPGCGPPGARIMFIGEAPGRQEDRQGKPFVGMAGKALDRMLTSIKLPRNQTYITSAVKCRPPDNRTPHVGELEICKANWLDRQVELIDPAVIVLLGSTAVRQMLGRSGPVTAVHGRIIERHGRRCLPTFPPAAAMRFPKIRAMMSEDFRLLKSILQTP